MPEPVALRYRDSAESRLREIDAWLKDYLAAVPKVPTGNPNFHEAIYDRAALVRQQLAEELKREKEVVVPRPHPRVPSADNAPGVPGVVAKVRFEDIPLTDLKCNGLAGLVPCGEAGDVAWHYNRLVFFSNDGAAKASISPGGSVSDAEWDGQQVWFTTLHGEIGVLSAEGKLLATIGPEHGLPPADLRIVLRLLAPGKARRRRLRRAFASVVRRSLNSAKGAQRSTSSIMPPACSRPPCTPTIPSWRVFRWHSTITTPATGLPAYCCWRRRPHPTGHRPGYVAGFRMGQPALADAVFVQGLLYEPSGR